MKKILEGKTILTRNEEIKFRNEEILSRKIEEKPLDELKSGFEDVVNSDVTKSWINRATEYIKKKYREIKEKLTGKETKANEGNEIDR